MHLLVEDVAAEDEVVGFPQAESEAPPAGCHLVVVGTLVGTRSVGTESVGELFAPVTSRDADGGVGAGADVERVVVARGDDEGVEEGMLEVGEDDGSRAELGGEEAAEPDTRAELEDARVGAPLGVSGEVVSEHDGGFPQARADAVAVRGLADENARAVEGERANRLGAGGGATRRESSLHGVARGAGGRSASADSSVAAAFASRASSAYVPSDDTFAARLRAARSRRPALRAGSRTVSSQSPTCSPATKAAYQSPSSATSSSPDMGGEERRRKRARAAVGQTSDAPPPFNDESKPIKPKGEIDRETATKRTRPFEFGVKAGLRGIIGRVPVCWWGGPRLFCHTQTMS